MGNPPSRPPRHCGVGHRGFRPPRGSPSQAVKRGPLPLLGCLPRPCAGWWPPPLRRAPLPCPAALRAPPWCLPSRGWALHAGSPPPPPRPPLGGPRAGPASSFVVLAPPTSIRPRPPPRPRGIGGASLPGRTSPCRRRLWLPWGLPASDTSGPHLPRGTWGPAGPARRDFLSRPGRRDTRNVDGVVRAARQTHLNVYPPHQPTHQTKPTPPPKHKTNPLHLTPHLLPTLTPPPPPPTPTPPQRPLCCCLACPPPLFPPTRQASPGVVSF
jgi:hypothetical protein